MRKNSIRKLIHGILDLLPLFVIPIFAININQKSVEPISITTGAWEHRNKYETNEVNSDNDLIEGHIYNLNLDTRDLDIEYLAFYCYLLNGNIEITFTEDLTYTSSTYNLQTNQKMMINCYANDSSIFIFDNNNEEIDIYGHLNLNNIVVLIEEFDEYSVGIYNNFSETNYNEIEYAYNEGHVYDDTDIGSQFLYSLYISTDNYFNMNNVFNLNGVYQWFELNIFGGSAPLSIYIVWNIIIYELVMDLLMLLYALFMFFIDACQKLIDKPLESIK